MDPESLLTQDQLESLRGCVPTKDECAKLRSYKGEISELSEAERWVHDIKGVSQMGERIQLQAQRGSFDADIASIRARTDAVAVACSEVHSSSRFIKVLQIVLKLGNALNSRQVSGFRLSSLLKLADVTSTANRSITLLDYLILDNQRKEPELLEWVHDMPSLANPAKSSACQDSNNVPVIRGDLGKLQGAVRLAASAAGLKLEEIPALESVKGGDPFLVATVVFCLRAKQSLQQAEESLVKAEAAAVGLLEYLAEPTHEGTAGVLGIIGTFQVRYKQRREHHKTSVMKKALSALASKTSSPEPPKVPPPKDDAVARTLSLPP